MAQWLRELNIKKEWEDAKRDVITVQQLSKYISLKLAKVRDFNDEDINNERDDLISDFEALSEDDSADKNEFDEIMQRLYDWADTPLDNKFSGKKVCWIKVF